MKKTIKGYLLGLICGVLLASGCAFAINHTTLTDVAIGGIKIVVDGKEIIPTDAKGNRVEPMIYNGTTYLPVRAVAQAFGKEVYWDGPNYTVYLGDMDGKLEYPTVELRDIIIFVQQIRDGLAFAGSSLVLCRNISFRSSLFDLYDFSKSD